MSRMSWEPPEGGIKTQKISEEKVRVYIVIVKELEDIDKVYEEGWKTKDGTTFLQMQDAVAQIAADHGQPYVKPPKLPKPPKVVDVVPGERYYKLKSFTVDTNIHAYRPYKHFRVVENGGVLTLEGAKSKEHCAKNKWTVLGIDDPASQDAV